MAKLPALLWGLGLIIFSVIQGSVWFALAGVILLVLGLFYFQPDLGGPLPAGDPPETPDNERDSS